MMIKQINDQVKDCFHLGLNVHLENNHLPLQNLLADYQTNRNLQEMKQMREPLF